MYMQRIATSFLSCAAMALGLTAGAGAQNNVSYVSTTGNDANDCTSSAYCRTIARALATTNSGGEVVVENSGSFGSSVSISQPVSISAIGVDASLVVTTSGADAITVNTTGNVSINGLTLRGHAATGNDGILVETVGVLHLNNMTIVNFANDGVEFKAAGGEMSAYNSNFNNNGHDGLQVNAAGAKAYVEGSAFDGNAYAGGDSVDGKLTLSDSNAHYNDIGFFANGGSVTLYNARAIFNTYGLQVAATGHLHFANCLLSDNTNAWKIAAGGVLSGSSPGTTLVVPGQTKSGTLSAPVTLE
jgi:hypothetical protein